MTAQTNDWKAIAEVMLRYEPEGLLQRRSSIASLEQDARESLSYAAQRQPFALHSVVVAIEDGIKFLMAPRKPGDRGVSHLIVYCLQLKDFLDDTIRELENDKNVARLISNIRQAKKRHALRFQGIGTRGLKLNAPRNRIVIRLFDYMEEFRERWELFVPIKEREKFKPTLHPTAQKIVILPSLTPTSALLYHRVSRAVLKNAAGKTDFTYHPAFAAGGEFHDLATQRKSLDAALNEAWRELAKRLKTDGNPSGKRQDSRKVR